MLQWIINKLLTLWANPAVAAVVKATITDVTTHGVNLAEKAIILAKEAQANNLDNKASYVLTELEKEFPEAGKSVLNNTLESAVSAVKQGLA